MNGIVLPPYAPLEPPFGPREYPCRKDDRYSSCFSAIDEKYKTADKILKAGTILYRGTLFNTLYNPSSTAPVFFGLDILISTWILSENYHTEIKKPQAKAKNFQFGYIHEFRLLKDLHYEYISELNCIPLNSPHDEKCNHMPCVHPQVILHTGVGCNDCTEVGTEITLPIKYVKPCMLEHVNTYKVDIKTLINNKDKNYMQFKFNTHLLKMPDAEYKTNNFILFPHGSKQNGAGNPHKTKEKIICKDGKTRVVYVGPRGGRYIKVKGELKRLTN